MSRAEARSFAKKVVFSFGRAFLGTALVLGIGLLSAPDFKFERAAVIALVVAAVVAGLRAVQAVFYDTD